MNKKARVILTTDCTRKCDSCVNTFESVQKRAIPLRSIYDLPLTGGEAYKEIIITGGEPLLEPGLLLALIRYIYSYGSGQRIYLYTSIYTPELRDFRRVIDGITYSIHYPYTKRDKDDFLSMQARLTYERWPSPRLIVDDRVYVSRLSANVWRRIDRITWFTEKENPACIPPGEDLYIYRP